MTVETIANYTSTVVSDNPNVDANRERITVLDGLRGYAVLMVMWHHFFMGNSADDHQFLVRWVVRAIGSGWVGVDLFFVLSGFLITGILLEAKDKPNYFVNFYARRTLRIFPLYYGVLFLVLIVVPASFRHGSEFVGSSLDHQWWLWCYLTNFAVITFGSWYIFAGSLFRMGHFWTLAVEEHFYLIWPLVIRFLRHRALIWGCIAVIATAVGSRLWYRLTLGNNDSTAPAILTYCRMDSLATGGLVAVLLQRFGISRLRVFAIVGTIVGGAGITGLFSVEHGLRAAGSRISVFNFSLLDSFFACLLLTVVAAKDSHSCRLLFANRPALTMGKYSYGLYVYHGLIAAFFGDWITVRAVQRFVPTNFFAWFVHGILWGGVAFLCAFLSWHAFEKQALKLKRFF